MSYVGAETPRKLLEGMLEDAVNQSANAPYDAIVITGDLVKHGIALKDTSNST